MPATGRQPGLREIAIRLTATDQLCIEQPWKGPNVPSLYFLPILRAAADLKLMMLASQVLLLIATVPVAVSEIWVEFGSEFASARFSGGPKFNACPIHR